MTCKKHGGHDGFATSDSCYDCYLARSKQMFIAYDGKYPNLCNGTLLVSIGGKMWEFPKGCLSSSGSVMWREGTVTEGQWSIDPEYYPVDFPEDRKVDLIDLINRKITLGCCGGCI